MSVYAWVRLDLSFSTVITKSCKMPLSWGQSLFLPQPAGCSLRQCFPVDVDGVQLLQQKLLLVLLLLQNPLPSFLLLPLFCLLQDGQPLLQLSQGHFSQQVVSPCLGHGEPCAHMNKSKAAQQWVRCSVPVGDRSVSLCQNIIVKCGMIIHSFLHLPLCHPQICVSCVGQIW